MSPGKPPPEVGIDPVVTGVICLLFVVPVFYLLFKMVTAMTLDDQKPPKKQKGKHGKAEPEPAPDDPMAWFAGKLQDIATSGERAKAAAAEEGAGFSPEELWKVVDSNGDGLLSMGEFKRGVQSSETLQNMLFTSNRPDVKLMKTVFKEMQDVHRDKTEITREHFLEFWNKIDADHSGKVTKEEFQASRDKKK